MSIERKANRVLERAQALAQTAESWVDFSNAMYDQFNGVVAKTFSPGIERQTFYDSEQYKQIQGILTDLMRKFGVADGAHSKQKSGRFVVRVPTTIHQKLDIEAKQEGVSLNQLAVTKLSVPLIRSTNLVVSTIAEAFNSTHGGYSTDWVIIDPHHDALFLERCRALGIQKNSHSDFLLNHMLMNIRKTKKYKGILNSASKPSGFKSYDDCAFASEIAVRSIERSDGIKLDRILCDPDILRRFDALALELAPSHTAIKLRCAALNLRKTHRLKPIDLTSDVYKLVAASPVKEIKLSAVESKPGVYAFYDYTRPLFAGETDNLHRRIEAHLDSGLPAWMKDKTDEGFILKYSAEPSMKRQDRLDWLGTFINREKPVLNYQRAA
jgi:hypothetical protein